MTQIIDEGGASVGVLDNLERGLERAVRTVFTAGGARKVKPVEIANALRLHLDRESISLHEGRTLVPNVFSISFSPQNFEQIRHWGSALAEELCDEVIRHSSEQGYTLQGPVRVTFLEDQNVSRGDISIESETQAAQSTPAPAPRQQRARQPAPVAPTQLQPVLEIDGTTYSFTSASVVIGRSSEADITIQDPGISRRHLEVRVHGDSVTAVDLGSTNGFYINGQKAQGSAVLRHGDTVTAGRTRMTFRMVPKQQSRQGGF
ncbi:FhaA domain-containing protein [Auritidibacter ignavus]|uniref:FhaA domain-containing protein n=1 Tax=Auritidibacter ignavus TaxID=678932 RepID=UPI0016980048|nr:DUF3662 and FHA domain-containing protein [Auritidibacter ignavus]NIH72675.1 hypothetical protein [Auritidibacter ignavus]